MLYSSILRRRAFTRCVCMRHTEVHCVLIVCAWQPPSTSTHSDASKLCLYTPYGMGNRIRVVRRISGQLRAGSGLSALACLLRHPGPCIDFCRVLWIYRGCAHYIRIISLSDILQALSTLLWVLKRIVSGYMCSYITTAMLDICSTKFVTSPASSSSTSWVPT